MFFYLCEATDTTFITYYTISICTYTAAIILAVAMKDGWQFEIT